VYLSPNVNYTYIYFNNSKLPVHLPDLISHIWSWQLLEHARRQSVPYLPLMHAKRNKQLFQIYISQLHFQVVL